MLPILHELGELRNKNLATMGLAVRYAVSVHLLCFLLRSRGRSHGSQVIWLLEIQVSQMNQASTSAFPLEMPTRFGDVLHIGLMSQ